MAKSTSKVQKKNLLPMLAIFLSAASIALALLVVVQMKVTEKQNQLRLEHFMDAVQNQLDELEAANGAQELTQPTNTSSGPSEPTGPLTYDLDTSLARVTQIEFEVLERFSVEELEARAAECQTETRQGYFETLSYNLVNQDGYEYIFTYTGESQAPESYSVTVIPNAIGYQTLAEFQADFDYCAAGGESYPVALNEDWLMFESSCGTGFSDDSGLPIGCSEVKESLGDSVQLK